MGVKYVCVVDLGDNMIGTAGTDLLKARLEALSAELIPGIYKVNCRMLQRSGSGQQGFEPLYIITDSDTPTKRYALMTKMLEANEEFDALLDKVKGRWAAKKTAKIEGHTYKVGDFMVKVGTLTCANSLKGIVVEIEYTPCSSISQCTALLQEFALNFVPVTSNTSTIGSNTTNPSTPTTVGTPTNIRIEVKSEVEGGKGHFSLPVCDYAAIDLSPTVYSNMHTAYQYIQLIKKKW